MRYAVVDEKGTVEIHETTFPIQADIIREVLKDKSKGSTDEGWLEGLTGPSFAIYLNENGKYLALKPNRLMTSYARKHHMISDRDFIVGNCVLTGLPNEEGYETSITDEALTELVEHSFTM